jgi:hypothetical protein
LEVNRLGRASRPELKLIEKEEEYVVPDNSWAVELLPDVRRVLPSERVVKGRRNIILLSKIMEG